MNAYQVKQEAGILLNANESPYPLSASLLEEIKESLDTIAFHRYPDDSATKLREAYASYLPIKSENIIVGNGSDEMIGLIISLCITKDKKVYTLAPDFSMYDYYTARNDGLMVTYPYEMDQTFDCEAFIAHGKANDVSMILFSNPNNPTGKIISQQDIQAILAAFPDIAVVVDEAYGEFAEESALSLISSYPNLIVLRTMSKAFGMAALRCGFLISHASTIAKIRELKVPYNVNALTQQIAILLLQHTAEMRKHVETIKQQRDSMYQTITNANCKDFTIYPSKANYLYGSSVKKQLFLQALKEKQIVIRNYENSNAFRITIGTPEENKLVTSIILELFATKERKL